MLTIKNRSHNKLVSLIKIQRKTSIKNNCNKFQVIKQKMPRMLDKHIWRDIFN